MLLFLIAYDNQGNVILNPSVYDTQVQLQLIYPDIVTYGTGNPNVQMSVTYGATDPAGVAGTTATATANFASLPVYSPEDQISANLQSGIQNGTDYGIIVANIGTPAFPAPIVSPSPFPSAPPTGASYVAFAIFPPVNGQITVTDSNYNALTSVQILGTYGYQFFYVSETGYYGQFTETDTCSGIASIYFYNPYGPNGYFDAYGVAPGACSATFSDGTNSVTLPLQVTTTSVTAQ